LRKRPIVEIERARLGDGALAGRIEGADAFQRIAEEIQPHRLFGARHEDIENAAAHGKFANFAYRRHPVETVALQPRGDVLHADLVAGPGRKPEAFDDVARRHLLQHGVDSNENDGRMRLLGVVDEAGKRRKPTRRCICTR